MERQPTSLVSQTSHESSPATPYLLASQAEDPTVDLNQSFPFPTFQEQSAIDLLKNIDEDRLFSWLTVVRSIEHGFSHRLVVGGLTAEQLNALSVLRDCLDSEILFWIQYSFLSGKSIN